MTWIIAWFILFYLVSLPWRIRARRRAARNARPVATFFMVDRGYIAAVPTAPAHRPIPGERLAAGIRAARANRTPATAPATPAAIPGALTWGPAE